MERNNTITSIRLPAGDETLKCVSDLLTQEHVLKRIDGRLCSFFGVYKLMEAIKSGAVRVYGAFNDEHELLGICFGMLQDDFYFDTHTMFYRGVDVAKCYESCMGRMIQDYADGEIKVKGVVGYIPDFHKAAILMARRAGLEDCGIRANKIFIRDGVEYPCRMYRRDL